MSSSTGAGSHALERWLLPEIEREGEAFGAMLKAVQGQLTSLEQSWSSLKDEDEWPDEYADALSDEGAATEAIQVQIADIALTAIFHWIERRLTLLLAHKARANGEPPLKVKGLRQAGFSEKVSALKDRGVALATLPQYRLIDSVLREFSNSWKHRDQPKAELLKALKITASPPPLELLEDDAIRRGMANAVGLRADASVPDIVHATAEAATTFLRSAFDLAFPQT
jgi:hypothetical protein